MEAVQEMYERAADSYAALRAGLLVNGSGPLLSRLQLHDARVIVDAGTGTGGLLPLLRAAAPDATIVGLDLTTAMLRHARAERADLVQADLAHPPLRPGSVDVLVSAFVLFHLADPPAAVRELAAALRPGGSFAVATWTKDEPWVAKSLFSAELDAAGAPPVSSSRVGAAHTETPEALTALAESAGLRVLETEVAPLGAAPIDAGDLVAEWAGIGSTGARFAELDAAARQRVLTNATEKIAALSEADRRDPHVVIRLWATKN
ncbi:MAG TPA: methyltransferase domain-containing protein [Pseudonocardiaceae bacterium]|jgi:ubiquinone/menaquinone biosynthesis C-methylase UbiE